MVTVTIPTGLIRKEKKLVLISRRQYKRFLDLEKLPKKRLREETDTDLALKIYKAEKRQGKLKIIKSLADLG